MSFSFSDDLVDHYHTELYETLEREGIDAFRIGGGEAAVTKQLSVCFGGDSKARSKSFRMQLQHLDLNATATQSKYEIAHAGTIHLTNSLIGYMLADVVVLCFDDNESIERWLQDVEFAFLTLQAPVNKDKSLVISCGGVLNSASKLNSTKIALNTLKQRLIKINFSDILQLNLGAFGLIKTQLESLVKQKGKNKTIGYGGMVLIPSGINRNIPDSKYKLWDELQIGRPFLVSQGKITQELYEHVMGVNPSEHKGSYQPIENVSWIDLVTFSNKLSGKEACYSNIGWRGEAEWIDGSIGYRLPTSQEWEYACRAFSDYKFSGSDNAEDVAWIQENVSKLKTLGQKLIAAQPVGQLKMNGFGLYDMSSNGREWCWDQMRNEQRMLRGGMVGDTLLRVNAAYWISRFANDDLLGNSGRLVRSLR